MSRHGWLALNTIDTIAAVKRQGWNPLFLARGGVEAHGAQVLQAAAAAGACESRNALPPGLA